MLISAPTPSQAPTPPRIPEAPSADSILCYRTVSGEQLEAQAQTIENILFAVGKASPSEGVFFLTPDKRRLSYANTAAMFTSQTSDLPVSVDAAESGARRCMQEINTALGHAGVLAAMKVNALLPNGLKLLTAAPVYHPETLAIDHWRCIFLPLVRSSVSVTEIEVSHAEIEVRIGGEGRMLGLVMQWWPITQSIICSPLAPPNPRDLDWTSQASLRAGSGEAKGANSGGVPKLVYAVFQNGSESQLLPYYIFESDPLARRYPAAQGMKEMRSESSTMGD